jgi:hypothetical protein
MRIPVELYWPIIEHVGDKKTLFTLLVTSKRLSNDIERKIYRVIKCRNPTSHKLFLETVLDPRRAHLSRFVHSYNLFRAQVYEDDFGLLLTRALPTFVNLKHLSFSGSDGLPSAQVLPVENPPPFQLHSFYWLRGRNESHLATFLGRQSSLELLWLLFKPENFSLSVTSLPKLRILSGSEGIILEILHNRKNITQLHWDPYSTSLSSDITSFPSFSNIRIFSFGILGSRPTLGNVLPLLQSIEILELGRFDVSPLSAKQYSSH